jgi:hypothetical protein
MANQDLVKLSQELRNADPVEMWLELLFYKTGGTVHVRSAALTEGPWQLVHAGKPHALGGSLAAPGRGSGDPATGS